jgi:hypothetical protein
MDVATFAPIGVKNTHRMLGGAAQFAATEMLGLILRKFARTGSTTS